MDEESKRSARESCEYPGYDPPSFARSEALSLAPVSLLEPIVPLIESRRENILLSSSLCGNFLYLIQLRAANYESNRRF